jgi:hypothetical protein
VIGRRKHGHGRLGAVVAGALVIVVLGGGSGYAGTLIGSRQIADNSIRSRDVRDGTLLALDLAPGTQAALRGQDGSTGQQGPAGAEGQPGADAIGQVVGFQGPVATIAAGSGQYVFAGPSALITTTATYPRISGSASAGLGLLSGAPMFADVGMCHQPAGGGELTNFVGASFTQSYFTTARTTYVATASVPLPPGTYRVGMCVRNNGAGTMNNNATVNGWTQVTR